MVARCMTYKIASPRSLLYFFLLQATLLHDVMVVIEDISEPEFFFVDLQQDPPQMVEPSKESNLGMQLTSIQKLFSSTFPLHGSNNDTTTALDEANSSQPSLFIDLSCCLQDTKVTIPTLNGYLSNVFNLYWQIWLLEYPVVYLFGTYHIEDAIYNLPTKSLRIFKVLVQRANKVTTSDLQYHHGYFADINNNVCMKITKSEYEVWAEAFLERMSSRWEECKHIWICKFPNVILKQLFFKVRAGTVRSSTMLQSKAPTYESRAPVVSTDVC
ncbi:BnaC04g22260D [Brassica napus]|uniref:BnaC04g22260D protein n=2 Tax=Brassica TaxID=3705 RepID=A0A078HW38_BRANA|nr:BnaC04g22260D [Brassica napus]